LTASRSEEGNLETASETHIREVLARQYRASLEMLRQAVAACPEALWLDSSYPNRFWHIAYHTLFCTHMYLQPGHSDFRPWANHRPDYQFLGPLPWPPHERPKIEAAYGKAEVLDLHGICREEVDATVPTVDLDAPSGFFWLPFNKLELQLYNIRHLQHHAGQLIDRLRTEGNIEVAWIAGAMGCSRQLTANAARPQTILRPRLCVKSLPGPSRTPSAETRAFVGSDPGMLPRSRLRVPLVPLLRAGRFALELRAPGVTGTSQD
jgi:hypothetical protein